MTWAFGYLQHKAAFLKIAIQYLLKIGDISLRERANPLIHGKIGIE